MNQYMKKISIPLFLILHSLAAQMQQPDGAELQLAVNKLSVLGSVLYVAAHPDDENTALLSYFAKGRLYRTAYLSITRGEGGQNLIGSELGAELGVIRTQELLAARRIDGAEQYFTRAIDFGFSKSSDEALSFWNKDSVLKDVVRVIRKFRPDIIITRFSPTQGGHGHHLASAILAQEAFKISGDPNIFPEQLQYVRPWKAKRILFNHFRFGGTNSNQQNVPSLKIDVGEYNPLLGRSYTELAGISRTMHKSQGMGSAQRKGIAVNEFVVTDGSDAKNDIMDGIDIGWQAVKNGKQIGNLIATIQKNFRPSQPEKSVPSLIQLRKELLKQSDDVRCAEKVKEVESLIIASLGISTELTANDHSYTNGDSLFVTLSMINRSVLPVSVSSFSFPALSITATSPEELKTNQPLEKQFRKTVPYDLDVTQPYWLQEPAHNNLYSIAHQTDIGMAVKESPLTADIVLLIMNEPVMITLPLQFKWIDDIAGEMRRAVEIVPPVSVSVTKKSVMENRISHSLISVQVKSMTGNLSGIVRLNVPDGWESSAEQRFNFAVKDEEKIFQFYVRPDSAAASGTFTVEAVIDGRTYSRMVKRISYPHIPTLTLLERAEGKLLNLDLKKIGRTIGYIMGAGDEVPKALEQMGYTVSMISDEELQSGDLSKFDAIVAGIRAYNTRAQVRQSNARLMEYVERGGTYVVQYQVMERGQTDNIAPFPMEISRDRVTDETAAVSFVDARHPALNFPNRITEKDFEGWVQERGLYFPNKWDNRFTPILSFADPNEPSREGGLLVAKHGKGHYIFTGLAFFRQLPAGVEGAYRLFANLVSMGK
ncbi:MAG: PIG-L family deacetylase [Ignavibacteriales bacterium]|nr:PIG-L family deacetylase [Ignavibacteriales bacterium]